MNAGDAWRVALVASLANLLFKAGITAAFGTRAVFKTVALVFGLTAVLGLVLVAWWPDPTLPGIGMPPPQP